MYALYYSPISITRFNTIVLFLLCKTIIGKEILKKYYSDVSMVSNLYIFTCAVNIFYCVLNNIAIYLL